MAPEDLREEEHALDRAVRALARRDHSARVCGRSSTAPGVSESAQAAALDALERAGYVDDARYAA